MTRTTTRSWPSLVVLGILAFVAGCTVGPTATPQTGTTPTASTASTALASTGPTSEGPIDPAALQARIGAYVNMAVGASDGYRRLLRGFIVSVDGDVIFERYAAGIDPSATANIFSVTKSVMSTLIGIAIGEGSIPGVDARLGALLPDKAAAMPDAVRAVTLEQVLTMSGGFTAAETFLTSDDWVQAILTDPANRPGSGEFEYANASSHLLSAILVEATGRPVLDYARDKLFDPLGISTRPATDLVVQPGPAGDFAEVLAAYNAVTGFTWPVDPTGLAVAFSDLKISTRDLLAIGQLYLDGGRHDAGQIVPADWVSAATTIQIGNTPGFGDGYGYQWWVGKVSGHPTYAAIGYGGQLIQVVPDLGLVAAASSTDGPGALSATSISTDLVEPIVAMFG
jgi:CubicO group peptidase (beta-lactamase class C family)